MDLDHPGQEMEVIFSSVRMVAEQSVTKVNANEAWITTNWKKITKIISCLDSNSNKIFLTLNIMMS